MGRSTFTTDEIWRGQNIIPLTGFTLLVWGIRRVAGAQRQLILESSLYLAPKGEPRLIHGGETPLSIPAELEEDAGDTATALELIRMPMRIRCPPVLPWLSTKTEWEKPEYDEGPRDHARPWPRKPGARL